MKRESLIIASMAIAVLILGLVGPKAVADARADTYEFKMGATSVRSGLYANTVAMAEVVNRVYDDISMTVVETGGYVENLERLRRATIDAGPASTGAAAASYQGIMDWDGDPDEELRTLWGGYFTPIHLIASKDSGITTVEGFENERFAMNPGTTSGWHIHNFFQALDLQPDYQLMGLGASPDAMKAGTVHGWFKAGFQDAAVMDIEAAMDIEIIDLEERLIEEASEVQPGIHRSTTIPEGLFDAVESEQLSYAYVVSDFVRQDIPDDVVYDVVKAIWENRHDMIEPLATLQEGQFDKMVENAVEYELTVPFHAGAVKFYEEIGKELPDELVPPEAK